MIASCQHVVLNSPPAARRPHIEAVLQDAKTYTNEELNESHALLLDEIEEHEERISRIEKCLLDLCFALRCLLSDLDFSELKKRLDQDLKKQGSEQGSGTSRAVGASRGRGARKHCGDALDSL